MRQFRLSTLMLLIVIVACCIALVVQYRRTARRKAEWKAQITRFWKYRPLKAEMSSRLKQSKAATGVMAGVRADGS